MHSGACGCWCVGSSGYVSCDTGQFDYRKVIELDRSNVFSKPNTVVMLKGYYNLFSAIDLDYDLSIVPVPFSVRHVMQHLPCVLRGLFLFSYAVILFVRETKTP